MCDAKEIGEVTCCVTGRTGPVVAVYFERLVVVTATVCTRRSQKHFTLKGPLTMKTAGYVKKQLLQNTPTT